MCLFVHTHLSFSHSHSLTQEGGEGGGGLEAMSLGCGTVVLCTCAAIWTVHSIRPADDVLLTTSCTAGISDGTIRAAGANNASCIFGCARCCAIRHVTFLKRCTPALFHCAAAPPFLPARTLHIPAACRALIAACRMLCFAASCCTPFLFYQW